MSRKNPTFTESKIEPNKLREAVQKVFSYNPSASRKDSVESLPAVKHRNKARKVSKPPARSS